MSGGDDWQRSARVQVISLLRDHGPLHRADLARRAGRSRSTITAVVAELVRQGLVVRLSATAPGRRGRGRPGELVALSEDAALVLGVEFTINRVRAALGSLDRRIVATSDVELFPGQSWSTRLDTGVQLVQQLAARAGVRTSRIVAAGLGVPAPIELASGLLGSVAAANVAGPNPAGDVGRRLKLPVVVDNSARLEALAEVVWGAGNGARNVVYIKLDHGVGGGLVLDGRLFRGALGIAGEIGHISVNDGGLECPCGNRGCLEMYASIPALLKVCRRSLGPRATFDDLVTEVRRGEPSCVRAVGEVGRLVGTVLANACNLLDPELVVVGGGLAGLGSVLLEPLRAGVEKGGLASYRGGVPVKTSRLGDDAGVLGAVGLALRHRTNSRR